VTRKLAVILHRMWRDGTEFLWSNQKAAVAATWQEYPKFRRGPADRSPSQGEVTAIAWAPLRL
jgi:hypothetical protein